MADMKEKIVREINQLFTTIDNKAREYPQVQSIVEKTGQRAAYLAVGASLLLLIFVTFGAGPAALANLIGFAYPIYGSFKSLKTDGQEDDTMWLTYWVVYGFFNVFESLAFFLSKSWTYYLIKSAFLIWCYLPQTKGSQTVYTRVIEPILNRYEKQIDGAAESAAKAGEEVKGDVLAVGKEAKKKLVSAATTAVMDQMMAQDADASKKKE